MASGHDSASSTAWATIRSWSMRAACAPILRAVLSTLRAPSSSWHAREFCEPSEQHVNRFSVKVVSITKLAFRDETITYVVVDEQDGSMVGSAGKYDVAVSLCSLLNLMGEYFKKHCK